MSTPPEECSFVCDGGFYPVLRDGLRNGALANLARILLTRSKFFIHTGRQRSSGHGSRGSGPS